MGDFVPLRKDPGTLLKMSYNNLSPAYPKRGLRPLITQSVHCTKENKQTFWNCWIWYLTWNWFLETQNNSVIHQQSRSLQRTGYHWSFSSGLLCSGPEGHWTHPMLSCRVPEYIIWIDILCKWQNPDTGSLTCGEWAIMVKSQGETSKMAST